MWFRRCSSIVSEQSVGVSPLLFQRSGQIQCVACVLTFAGSHERALLCEVRQIASGCGRGSTCNRAVVARTQTALDSLGAFPEHANEHLLLPLVDLAAQPFQQLRRVPGAPGSAFGTWEQSFLKA